jgi:hypothetical protein
MNEIAGGIKPTKRIQAGLASSIYFNPSTHFNSPLFGRGHSWINSLSVAKAIVSG